MRAGSLRSAPLAGLVSAHHAVHAGPCSVIRVASAWRKKLQTHKCGSAYPNCATCSPRCYGAGGTELSTCCIGPSGEDDINSELCAATIESEDRLCPHSIYNCSTSNYRDSVVIALRQEIRRCDRYDQRRDWFTSWPRWRLWQFLRHFRGSLGQSMSQPVLDTPFSSLGFDA